MKKFLLSFILISNFSFSQETDYQGFMDFSYNDDSGKIILEIDNLDNELVIMIWDLIGDSWVILELSTLLKEVIKFY
jgi:hypothetical protein